MRKTSVNGWLCLVTLFLAVNFHVQAQTWSFTGNMNYYHASHSATLLDNGEVLIAGGASLNVERDNGQRIVLLSNGSALVTGGEKYYTYRPRLLNTAEIYH